MTKSFTQNVFAVARTIPMGKTMTYADVAQRAGSPHAFRAVGSILAKNKDKKIPCHRVIGSDGSMRGYNGLCGKNKALILKREGVSGTHRA